MELEEIVLDMLLRNPFFFWLGVKDKGEDDGVNRVNCDDAL